jgi:ketosteroid isomerase-like protein
MRTVLRCLTVVPALALLACAETETEMDAAPAAEEIAPAAVEAADPAAVRQETDRMNAQFVEAVNRGDAAAAAQVYTEDARILPPDMAPIEGREGIQNFWAGGLQQMGMRDVQLTTDELEVAGDQAYEQGRFRFNTNQGPAQGKYIVVWRRTPEGWRWHRDIWNTSPAE